MASDDDAPPVVAGPASGTPAQLLTDELALCLSGGGYRAMLFHLGALIRLNESGLLHRLGTVSSVSGGSITAGVLALRWGELDFDSQGIAARLDRVIDVLRRFARVSAVLRGILLPGTVNDRVIDAYRKHLFGNATLQALPGAGSPEFVLNATNVQTGSLWRFQRAWMGDYQVGLVDEPSTELAVAVAASSAFPPVLSPATLKITQPVRAVPGATLHRPPFTTEVVLSDGGVYDNLGLEVPRKRSRTILVSDGGLKMSPEPRPAHNWAEHAIRVAGVIDNQVRSLRVRGLIDSYERGEHDGTYWSIRSDVASYPNSGGAADPLNRARRDPTPLAAIRTRLGAIDDELQERLINWGYAICDTALSSHWTTTLEHRYGRMLPAQQFPYARGY